jgi:predicted nucleic acid-binding Zn ribbon protein
VNGEDGRRRGDPGGGPPRPRLANPYGLGTWSAAGARGPAEPAAETDPPAPEPARSPPPRPAGSGNPPERSGGAGDPDADLDPVRGVAPEVFYDPPELPAPADPFELARRTVNRSRAAARDRGLFPISAKTQARDVRDRSGRAPGYSGSRPDPRDPQGIENVLKKVLGNLGWTAGMNTGRVLEEWDEIVGERLATHCRPVSFEDGVLVVSASSSAWASQLRMLTPQLITTIEEHVGAHVVSELKVTGPAAAQRTWKKGRRTVTWRGPRDTYG